jgi:hypothetical protein
MQEPLQSLLNNYRTAANLLDRARHLQFPQGRRVIVHHPRYHGTGEVVLDERCPLDKLPVQLGNGNIWWYELETVESKA